MTCRAIPKTVVRAAALCAGALALAAGLAQPAAAQFRYDVEYPSLKYSEDAVDNPVAELIARIDSGETTLAFEGVRGFLDALLGELGIDPSSQVLVYSGTSLQFPLISAETPRALYFKDDTYVAWVQNSRIVEVATVDAVRGPIFYTFTNEQGERGGFRRENGRCLNCHDTQGMMGGGAPMLPIRSNLAARDGGPLDLEVIEMVTDRTPLSQRWGGWYVTGRHGDQVHLGNILVDSEEELADLDAVRNGNLDTLDGLLDTTPYLTDTSDIVALMVLEHQLSVQNALTYIAFKAPAVLQRMGEPAAAESQSWDALPERAKTLLRPMADRLVETMLFTGAIRLESPIESSSGFDAWFQAQGPRDAQGRSLRDLDLEGKLFAWPLSYQIYTPAFDHLPAFAKDYVYGRIAAVLDGSDESEAFAHITDEDRAALREILEQTKPDIVPYLAGASGGVNG